MSERSEWFVRCLTCEFESREARPLDVARAIRRHHEKETGHPVNIEWRPCEAGAMRRALPLLWLFLIAILTFGAAGATAQEREESKAFRVLGWATYGTVAADAITTEIGLCRGAREVNPLQRNRAVRLSTHAAFGIGFNYGTAKLYANHPKVALWMRIGAVAFFGFLTAHNAAIAF